MVVVVVNAAPWFCFILVWFEDDWCRAPWRRFGLGIILTYYIVAQKDPRNSATRTAASCRMFHQLPHSCLSVCFCQRSLYMDHHGPCRRRMKRRRRRDSLCSAIDSSRHWHSCGTRERERSRHSSSTRLVPKKQRHFRVGVRVGVGI